MSEWHDVTMADISDQRKGINYKSEYYCDEDSGHPFITIKCFVKGGGYQSRGIKFFDGPFTPQDKLSAGDILISVTDLTRAGDIVGSPLQVPDFGSERSALASMDCMKIAPKNGMCDSEFLYFRMMLPDIRHQMVAYSAGSTVLHLDTKKVPSMKIRIPKDIAHQKKLARVLKLLTESIEQTEALIEKYSLVKAGMMHDLFTRGLTPDGKLRPPREEAPGLYKETPIGWIPKEWEVESIKTCFGAQNIVNGPFGSDLLKSELRQDGVPVLYVQDVKPDLFKRVSKANVTLQKAVHLSFCNVRKGDILLAKVGSPPCDSCVYDRGEHAIVTQDVIRIRTGKKHDSQFFSSLFNSTFGRKSIKRIAIEGTRERVALGDIKSLLLPVPLQNEQVLIGERLRLIHSLVSKETEMRTKLNKKKSGLMHDLLTGKVPVKLGDPEDAHV